MEKEIIIIGGGIIGLCTAYYLQKDGHKITVIDQSNMDSGASYVNAGYIIPSHFISMAAPGIITKGIKWMFNSESPFYVKPRLDADFLKWVLAFKKSATKERVEQSISALKNINLLSRDLYEDMKRSGDFNFHYERKGLLMCYKSNKVGEEEWEIGKRGIKEGLGVKHLSAKEVKVLEPKANLNIKGAVYYDCDGHMTPNHFMNDMTTYLKSKGVVFYTNEKVNELEVFNDKIVKVLTDKRTLIPDEVILTAGSWSPLITKKLGIKIPVQAGKGYGINVEQETKITIPTILCEAKVAVTPMDGFTRFAGTMEIAGINHNINPKRVNSIANAAQRYYNNLEITLEEKKTAECGLRPVSPDGIPYIGKSSKCKNLTIATGHAMMGWSLGPATGKLVSEIISDKKSSLDISCYHPDRKF
ncbi:D-amino acid oxidase [Psychroflexus torquis ATCC 700755]|uniref:D-amino acid oxidase n=1 Tax=Psychroflexus torquis (strain ATCC 700755 / CIP 106069 / ACAM 623) TaxID=313595 RepID=K4IKG6_PSYTT|nr:FAD-dependent oxidoreductase [Psychroflexus torquis]AFU69581.1 D-amino acid oxidase [Psychroflexus torquis ATCC 700755]